MEFINQLTNNILFIDLRLNFTITIQFYSNGTCVEKAHCEVCDEDGHHSGDIWNEDACTTCSCVGTNLLCESQHCPAVETVCGLGYTPVKMPAGKDECCDKYICGTFTLILPLSLTFNIPEGLRGPVSVS